MVMRFKFRPAKALEAILYVAPRVKGRDMYLTLKTLYVADKLHLERYGRFVFGDWYTAMENGPVGSNAYDVVKFVRGDNDHSPIADAEKALTIDGNTLNPLREPNMDALSETDVECLQEAVETYGSLSFSQARDASHDAAWDATEQNTEIATTAIAATLANGPELIQHLEDRHPDD